VIVPASIASLTIASVLHRNQLYALPPRSAA
jgi:hypothetical protein